MPVLPFLVGLGLSLATAGFARLSGFDRDRAFYPTVLIVVASYYVLFAAMSGVGSAVAIEMIVMATFATVAVIGFKSSPWIIAIGLIGHGVFDAFHGQLYTNPGVPTWWPAFCGAFDIGAGGVLAYLAAIGSKR